MRKTATSDSRRSRPPSRYAMFFLLTACAGRVDVDRAVERLAADVANELPPDTKPMVAVSDFVGEDYAVARYVTDSFAERLQKSGRLRLVDRQHLKDILGEQKLGAENLVDDATAARIGHLTGAGLICVGEMRPVADEMQLRVKFVDSTSAVIAVSESEFVSKAAVKAMQPQVESQQTAPVAEVRATSSNTGTIVLWTLVGVAVAGAVAGLIVYATVPPSGRLGVVQF